MLSLQKVCPEVGTVHGAPLLDVESNTSTPAHSSRLTVLVTWSSKGLSGETARSLTWQKSGDHAAHLTIYMYPPYVIWFGEVKERFGLNWSCPTSCFHLSGTLEKHQKENIEGVVFSVLWSVPTVFSKWWKGPRPITAHAFFSATRHGCFSRSGWCSESHKATTRQASNNDSCSGERAKVKEQKQSV